MCLYRLHELLESWRGECPVDGNEIQASDCGGRGGFILAGRGPRTSRGSRASSCFLSGDVTYRGSEYAMPRGELRQRGPPRRQLRIDRHLCKRLASQSGFQLRECLASGLHTLLQRPIGSRARNHLPIDHLIGHTDQTIHGLAVETFAKAGNGGDFTHR